ncbi:MAG: lysophospholipase [Planctomycetota bacterium]|nr:MAG: lysophospholipase [Planctomycetota bacterium]
MTNRRSFLQTTAAAAFGSAAFSSQVTQAESSAPPNGLVHPGDVVLFQGDSITDTGRSRDKAAEPNNQAALGNGYAFMAAANLLTNTPDLKVFNRGISGHKVFQLADRWQADCLDLQPNVLSILIGVNDIWHKRNGKYDGTVEVYERDYNTLLERTVKAMPQVKLVICEPFVLRCGAIDDSWFPEFDGYRAAAKRVAEKAKAVFVPFHSMFEAAVKLASPEHWAKDGVHPSPYGAALMAHAWTQAVR